MIGIILTANALGAYGGEWVGAGRGPVLRQVSTTDTYGAC